MLLIQRPRSRTDRVLEAVCRYRPAPAILALSASLALSALAVDLAIKNLA